MSLSHHTPDCTGRWGLRVHRFVLYWVCGRCEAKVLSTVANLMQALGENAVSNQMVRLANEGRKLLDTNGTTS